MEDVYNHNNYNSLPRLGPDTGIHNNHLMLKNLIIRLLISVYNPFEIR